MSLIFNYDTNTNNETTSSTSQQNSIPCILESTNSIKTDKMNNHFKEEVENSDNSSEYNAKQEIKEKLFPMFFGFLIKIKDKYLFIRKKKIKKVYVKCKEHLDLNQSHLSTDTSEDYINNSSSSSSQSLYNEVKKNVKVSFNDKEEKGNFRFNDMLSEELDETNELDITDSNIISQDTREYSDVERSNGGFSNNSNNRNSKYKVKYTLTYKQEYITNLEFKSKVLEYNKINQKNNLNRLLNNNTNHISNSINRDSDLFIYDSNSTKISNENKSHNGNIKYIVLASKSTPVINYKIDNKKLKYNFTNTNNEIKEKFILLDHLNDKNNSNDNNREYSLELSLKLLINKYSNIYSRKNIQEEYRRQNISSTTISNDNASNIAIQEDLHVLDNLAKNKIDFNFHKLNKLLSLGNEAKSKYSDVLFHKLINSQDLDIMSIISDLLIYFFSESTINDKDKRNINDINEDDKRANSSSNSNNGFTNHNKDHDVDADMYLLVLKCISVSILKKGFIDLDFILDEFTSHFNLIPDKNINDIGQENSSDMSKFYICKLKEYIDAIDLLLKIFFLNRNKNKGIECNDNNYSNYNELSTLINSFIRLIEKKNHFASKITNTKKTNKVNSIYTFKISPNRILIDTSYLHSSLFTREFISNNKINFIKLTFVNQESMFSNSKLILNTEIYKNNGNSMLYKKRLESFIRTILNTRIEININNDEDTSDNNNNFNIDNLFKERKYSFEFFFLTSNCFSRNSVYFFNNNYNNGKLLATYYKFLGLQEILMKQSNFFKVISRMSQNFSTTIDIQLPRNTKIEVQKDIERNGHCYSDGSGEISNSLFYYLLKQNKNQLISFFNLKSEKEFMVFTSALQVRYSGCKGLLVKSNNINNEYEGINSNNNNSDYYINFKDSMTKYNMNNDYFNRKNKFNLQINNVSVYRKGKINCQILYLLSVIGIKKSIITKMIISHLQNTTNDNNCSKRNKNINVETNFNSYIQSFYYNYLNFTLKTKIQIKKSVLLFGIPDIHGVLNKNEVFVQLGYTNNTITENTDITDTTTLNIKILGRKFSLPAILTKNPCTATSDIQLVNCVCNDLILIHYRNIYNVVVFNIKDEVPLCTKISGSDFDGDLYFLCWEKELTKDLKKKLLRDDSNIDFFNEDNRQDSIHTCYNEFETSDENIKNAYNKINKTIDEFRNYKSNYIEDNSSFYSQEILNSIRYLMKESLIYYLKHNTKLGLLNKVLNTKQRQYIEKNNRNNINKSHENGYITEELSEMNSISSLIFTQVDFFKTGKTIKNQVIKDLLINKRRADYSKTSYASFFINSIKYTYCSYKYIKNRYDSNRFENKPDIREGFLNNIENDNNLSYNNSSFSDIIINKRYNSIAEKDFLFAINKIKNNNIVELFNFLMILDNINNPSIERLYVNKIYSTYRKDVLYINDRIKKKKNFEAVFFIINKFFNDENKSNAFLFNKKTNFPYVINTIDNIIQNKSYVIILLLNQIIRQSRRYYIYNIEKINNPLCLYNNKTKIEINLLKKLLILDDLEKDNSSVRGIRIKLLHKISLSTKAYINEFKRIMLDFNLLFESDIIGNNFTSAFSFSNDFKNKNDLEDIKEKLYYRFDKNKRQLKTRIKKLIKWFNLSMSRAINEVSNYSKSDGKIYRHSFKLDDAEDEDNITISEFDISGNRTPSSDNCSSCDSYLKTPIYKTSSIFKFEENNDCSNFINYNTNLTRRAKILTSQSLNLNQEFNELTLQDNAIISNAYKIAKQSITQEETINITTKDILLIISILSYNKEENIIKFFILEQKNNRISMNNNNKKITFCLNNNKELLEFISSLVSLEDINVFSFNQIISAYSLKQFLDKILVLEIYNFLINNKKNKEE